MKRLGQPLSPRACERDLLPIALRAFVPPPKAAKGFRKSRKSGPSEWSLVWDCETTTAVSHQLRFGTYQVYRGVQLEEIGIFLDPRSLTKVEQVLLRRYASGHKLRLLSTDKFIDDIFYGIGYELRATIIGFNLPFDLSRLAIRHGPARGRTMRGGFTFQLSKNPWKPRVQIKHLSSRAALIQFTKPRRRNDTRGMRKRLQKPPERRGAFIDIKTQAAAQTSRSFNLAALAEFLATDHRKHVTEEHGGPLTEAYIAYAVRDVQVTWECYCKLLKKFEAHGFSHTRASQVLSEASIGKACLREMGIRPWRHMQPEFPDELTGIVMSTYYGGRSEMHWRRVPVQVLYCDFLSMYPTVCTLMNLWKIVIAKGVTWRECTLEVSEFLERITIPDLQRSETWNNLKTLVQVAPDDDIFPVRSKYDGSSQATIGTNYLLSNTPLWFTLADCIAGKLLTKKCPKVLRAISFDATEEQDDLRSIALAGNADYAINPVSDDFYRQIINLRNKTKSKLRNASGAEATVLDTEQLALKILANATSYGIFVEFIVEELAEPETRTCYGPAGVSFSTRVSKAENPGPYFHPLIATLITGAARLMLAIAETLATTTGIDWAFCDTDSMALAKPEGMDHEVFLTKALSICEWFTPLNPYEQIGPLFKIEDANYRLKQEKITDRLEPLFCLGVSAKRYALFNLGADGRPIIRKASAHGLGHLLAPYSAKQAPARIPAPSIPLEKIGVERWQYDLWYQIILAALSGHPDEVDLTYHPALDQPPASRYGATTPELLRWFKTFNEKKAYRDQVRPFGFLLGFQAIPLALALGETFDLDGSSRQKRQRRANPLKPIAPYNRNIQQAAQDCFDRETGKPIDQPFLKTYSMAVAQYHISPEPKFLNGEPYDQGQTCRRHVEVIAVNCIGKEANKWEEQHYLGLDRDAQIDYGKSPNSPVQLHEIIEHITCCLSQRELARQCGISRATLSKLIRGKPVRDAAGIIQRLLAVIKQAERDEQEERWRSTTRPKDQWLDRIGGFSAFEMPRQLNERIAEMDRLEKLLRSGTLAGDAIDLVHRRLCELKGIDFDGYDPPDD